MRLDIAEKKDQWARGHGNRNYPKRNSERKDRKINWNSELWDNTKEDSIQSRFCVTRVEEEEEKEKYLKK